MLTTDSFIEENHQHKESERQSQNTQQPRRGQASQEVMQYWGSRSHKSHLRLP